MDSLLSRAMRPALVALYAGALLDPILGARQGSEGGRGNGPGVDGEERPHLRFHERPKNVE